MNEATATNTDPVLAAIDMMNVEGELSETFGAMDWDSFEDAVTTLPCNK